jgi:citrate synthase
MATNRNPEAGGAGVADATNGAMTAPPGLEGLVVADTEIGDVRGREGFFHYRQYAAPDLARRCSFEEVWHLIVRGELPDEDQLARFRAEVGPLRVVPDGVATALPAVVAAGGSQFQMLRSAMSLTGQALGLQPWIDGDGRALRAAALRMTAVVPALVAALWRRSLGVEPVEPDPDRPVVEDYLRMVTGQAPSAEAVRAVERYLVLTIDHGFNASTFTARTVTSTGADVAAALVAALGALSGPLHGGAPSRALDMLRAIDTPEQARSWVDRALAGGDRIMGFGHRVYRTEDPRSALLKETAIEMGGELAALAVAVEDDILVALQAHRPGRELRTNVEYYAGVVLHLAGLPQELFTSTFAVSRAVGWSAHIAEQAEANRLIRPAARYIGEPPLAVAATA